MQEVENKVNISKRYISIDLFKGISIILMVFVNTLRPYENIPAWSKHARVYGLTYVDLVAPFFVFMLVINTHLSYNKHIIKSGRKHALLRHFRRFILFIIIGLILGINIENNYIVMNWGTLQVLGCSGLIFLLVIELKYYVRIILAIFLLIIHQLLLINGFAQLIFDSVEGGVYGVFAWGSMALFSSVIYDCMKIRHKNNYMMIIGILYIIFGLILNQFFQISRQYVSGAYILISIGCSVLLFNVLYLYFDSGPLNEQLSIRGNFIINLGKNAFFLYLLHLILIYFIYETVAYNAPALLAFFIASINVVIIYIIAYIMDKYKQYLVI